MMMLIRIKQQATFEVQFIKKLSNTEAELKKALLIKKASVYTKPVTKVYLLNNT